MIWRRLTRLATLARLATLLSLAALSLTNPARAAECETSELTTGVILENCGAFYVVRAELAAADVALRVSTPSERGVSVDRWLDSIPGAVVAVQAGDFEFPSYATRGLTVGEGVAWPDSRDNGGLAVIAFDRRGVGVFVPERQVVPAEPWMDSTLSGSALVRDGVPLPGCTGSGCVPMARTSIGLAEGGRELVIVVTPHATAFALAEFSVEAGAYDALQSGAGASSVLHRSEGPIVASSDGIARPGAAFLAIINRAGGGMTRLRGIVGDAQQMDVVLPMAEISVHTLDGNQIASSRPRTDRAYWEFPLPVREYIVRGSHEGYRSGCKICTGVTNEDVWCSLYLTRGTGEESCEPQARQLSVGPWPEASETVDGGGDAGSPPSPSPTCSALGQSDPGLLPFLSLVAVLYWRTSRRQGFS